jgi:hypothetical protein
MGHPKKNGPRKSLGIMRLKAYKDYADSLHSTQKQIIELLKEK